ncbi:BON domain-containing protein [Thiogranum longum]|jgi:osmotically-inducible protein OsmY
MLENVFMVKNWLILSALCFATLASSGCAPVVVVGGAATAGSVAHDRRTTGSVVEDQAIKMRIHNALNEDSEIDAQTHINVSSFNGIALLTGEAPTEALKNRAGEIARNAEKVRRLHNEIQIAAPSSMMTRSSDSWITTKVKTSLVGIKLEDFDPSRVKVVTENGTVFLLGLVTHAEAGQVTEKAREVSGVQRIVKLFEYID